MCAPRIAPVGCTGGLECAVFQLCCRGAVELPDSSHLPRKCEAGCEVFLTEKNIFARARRHARHETPRGMFSTLLPLLLSHILILPEAALSFPQPKKKNAITCFAVSIARLSVSCGNNPTNSAAKISVQWKPLFTTSWIKELMMLTFLLETDLMHGGLVDRAQQGRQHRAAV